MHDELDGLLRQRYVPEAPGGLAERIIAASLRQEVRRKWTLADTWQDFLDLFMLPQPAFALSILLIGGFALGLSAQSHPSYASSSEVMTSFGIADEGYEEGDFL
jgi:hypothetical protein